MELADLSIEELQELRKDCNLLIKESKKNENDELLKAIKKTASEMMITDRVRNFYENNNIGMFNFLYRSMEYFAGNNRKKLDYYTLLTHDKNTVEQLRKIGINNNIDFILKLNYKTNLLNNQDEINKKIEESRKLISLYKFFLNFENVINHQGTFYTFKYVTDTLNRLLVDTEKNDYDLIYNDWEQKIKYIVDNLANIATYLLTCKNSISNARLCICNQSLSRIANKKGETITFNEKIFISAISFGTTLDKLNQENYEDGKRLIYVPYKKQLKS